jgi:glycosyltransferase involved in cell wall biosynthesis
MPTPPVDVILPTHCRPHTIAYSIAAVLQQTYADFTLHVVGDGCDDATEAAVRSASDPRVRFYRFPKARGFGYANRNRVLRETTAPLVAYTADDDLWFPDHLERAVDELTRGELALVALRSTPVHTPDQLDPHFFAFDWRVPLLTPFLRNWFMGVGTVVHRRELLDSIGYWNEQLVRFGDREFYNRVRRSGAAMAYVDYVSVLRFYALHWDTHYARLDSPPQRRYLAAIADPAWRARVRAAAAPGPRQLAVRRRQWADFTRFALHSGPKFVRFWYERAAYGDGRNSGARRQ